MTPNELSQSPPNAGLLKRFAAMVYDSLLLVALSLAYGALATTLKVTLDGPPPEDQAISWGLWQWPLFIGLIAVWGGFFYYFWGRSGQTLGMRAWRLQLVDSHSGGLAGPRQRLLRLPMAAVSLGALGLGYFWLWLDPKRLALPDRLSHTRVLQLPKRSN